MRPVQVLGNERAELDGVGEEQKQPIEQNNAVGVARPVVFEVLDIENDTERDDGNDGGPEPEITGPDVLVVFDLQTGLQGVGSNKPDDDGLGAERHVRPGSATDSGNQPTTHQLCVEVPIPPHRLRGAFAQEVVHRRAATQDSEQDGNRGYPHVEETARQVPAIAAHWPPSLRITA